MPNRYEITHLIEKDQLGEVFMALDTTLQRKVVYRKFNSNADRVAADEIKEYAGKLCALQHPNILTVYDASRNDEGYYMVSQYIEAEKLTVRLQEGPLSQTGVYNMAVDLLEAFHAMHEIGLVHGSICFSSVHRLSRVRGGHRYLIVDLGLETMATMLGCQTISISDPSLLSPEDLESGVELNEPSDLFALGQLCYRALIGVNPLEGKSAEECLEVYRDGGLPHVKDWDVVVQQDFADWVMAMVAPCLDERPLTTDDAMASLHAIALNVPAPNVPGVTQAVVEVAPSVAPYASQPIVVDSSESMAGGDAKKKQTMMIVGLVALLLLVLIGVFVVRGGDGSEDKKAAGSEMIVGEGNVFIHGLKMVHSPNKGGKSLLIELDLAQTLDWTVVKGVDSENERVDREEGTYITSITRHGDFKEFAKSVSRLQYKGNGMTITPRGEMTNTSEGNLNVGDGWDLMLHIPKNHKGDLLVTFYMRENQCDFDIEVKAHDTKELVELHVTNPCEDGVAGVVAIPVYIKNPGPGAFYTLKILAAAEDPSQEFSMGLSAVHVKGLSF